MSQQETTTSKASSTNFLPPFLKKDSRTLPAQTQTQDAPPQQPPPQLQPPKKSRKELTLSVQFAKVVCDWGYCVWKNCRMFVDVCGCLWIGDVWRCLEKLTIDMITTNDIANIALKSNSPQHITIIHIIAHHHTSTHITPSTYQHSPTPFPRMKSKEEESCIGLMMKKMVTHVPSQRAIQKMKRWLWNWVTHNHWGWEVMKMKRQKRSSWICWDQGDRHFMKKRTWCFEMCFVGLFWILEMGWNVSGIVMWEVCGIQSVRERVCVCESVCMCPYHTK